MRKLLLVGALVTGAAAVAVSALLLLQPVYAHDSGTRYCGRVVLAKTVAESDEGGCPLAVRRTRGVSAIVGLVVVGPLAGMALVGGVAFAALQAQAAAKPLPADS